MGPKQKAVDLLDRVNRDWSSGRLRWLQFVSEKREVEKCESGVPLAQVQGFWSSPRAKTLGFQ